MIGLGDLRDRFLYDHAHTGRTTDARAWTVVSHDVCGRRSSHHSLIGAHTSNGLAREGSLTPVDLNGYGTTLTLRVGETRNCHGPEGRASGPRQRPCSQNAINVSMLQNNPPIPRIRTRYRPEVWSSIPIANLLLDRLRPRPPHEIGSGRLKPDKGGSVSL